LITVRFGNGLSKEFDGQTFGFAADLDWLTKQIAVGGAVRDGVEMGDLRRQGVTAILNMDGVDDSALAAQYGIRSFWNPVADDFAPKSPDLFERGVNFARHALAKPEGKLFVHCAAGMHRGPLMALAILASLGWSWTMPRGTSADAPSGRQLPASVRTKRRAVSAKQKLEGGCMKAAFLWGSGLF
jgi:hypothetical protein